MRKKFKWGYVQISDVQLCWTQGRNSRKPIIAHSKQKHATTVIQWTTKQTNVETSVGATTQHDAKETMTPTTPAWTTKQRHEKFSVGATTQHDTKETVTPTKASRTTKQRHEKFSVGAMTQHDTKETVTPNAAEVNQTDLLSPSAPQTPKVQATALDDNKTKSLTIAQTKVNQTTVPLRTTQQNTAQTIEIYKREKNLLLQFEINDSTISPEAIQQSTTEAILQVSAEAIYLHATHEETTNATVNNDMGSTTIAVVIIIM